MKSVMPKNTWITGSGEKSQFLHESQCNANDLSGLQGKPSISKVSCVARDTEYAMHRRYKFSRRTWYIEYY